LKDKIKYTRTIIRRKVNSAKSYFLWYYASRRLNLVLVSEFPKSGGTWYCQMLSDYLQIPYPRNKVPHFEKSVLHGHHYYSPSFNKPVCMIRDGRDALVSYYHHMYFGNAVLPPHIFEKYKQNAPFNNFENIKENMPAYIEYMFTKYRQAGHLFTWSGFVNSYLDKPDVIYVKYEDLLLNSYTTLELSIKQLGNCNVDNEQLQKTIEKYSFQNQTKRQPGEENKKEFLRKGIAGDWKNYFTKESCELFNYYAGKELVHFNYEKNLNWY
jgi:hypothetical protein